MILSLNACSTKYLSPNNTQCEQLPVFNKKNFRLIKKDESFVKKLIQVNAIKNCSCLEPSEQEACYKLRIPKNN